MGVDPGEKPGGKSVWNALDPENQPRFQICADSLLSAETPQVSAPVFAPGQSPHIHGGVATTF